MEQEYAIEVSHVSKSFRVYLDKGRTMKELMLFSKRRRYEDRKVLRDISFSVRKGEAIGLIGHNGCGKSTTLKLLTRIMYPDKGTITMRGRVSSLIELGAGFHPDMSGRENIYINASIFGLTRKEIDARLEDIITFSELEDYIDNPVRTYSSGMYMRLAFSVAINVNADILLIDEILAVGDAGFQEKCFNKMREIKAQGTTIVLVSHAMGQIEKLCDRSIWIDDGLIREEGAPQDVGIRYLEYMGHRRIEREEKERNKSNPSGIVERHDTDGTKEPLQRYGNGDAEITSYHLLNERGEETRVIFQDEPCRLEVSYKVNRPFKDAVFGIGIFRNDGVWCYGTNTRICRVGVFDLKRDGMYAFNIPSLPLTAGKYRIDVTIEYGEGNPVDYFKDAMRFEVISEYQDAGLVNLGHDFELHL